MLKHLSAKNSPIFLTGFILLLIGFTLGAYAQRKGQQARRNSFASLQAAVVQLGVYDKNLVLGEQRAYEAQFIVTGRDGKQYKSLKKATAEDTWVYAEFPYDFDSFPVNSNVHSAYRWECVVEGMTVAGGEFQWGGDRAVAVQ
jgi:hypothetical protein